MTISASKPKPQPKWTCWPDTAHVPIADTSSEDSFGTAASLVRPLREIKMAHVRLDVGQFSFPAAMQYGKVGTDEVSFFEACKRLMEAITLHAEAKEWL